MSKPLKPKRGTTAQNDAYIGEAYEVTLDTEKHNLRVHDGVTAGGHEIATEASVQKAISDKADVGLGNLSSSGRSLAAGLGMPSRQGTAVTLGSSDTRYTAPANGFFWVQKVATAANQKLALFNFSKGGSTIVGTRSISAAAGNTLHVFVPVCKGDIVSCSYDAAGEYVFRFTYAEGEEA